VNGACRVTACIPEQAADIVMQTQIAAESAMAAETFDQIGENWKYQGISHRGTAHGQMHKHPHFVPNHPPWEHPNRNVYLSFKNLRRLDRAPHVQECERTCDAILEL